LVPVLPFGNGVGAGGEHLMDRIEAPAKQTGLRPVGVERNAEREHLAALDQAGRAHNVLGPHVIERADLIVLAPAPPVLELLGGPRDRLLSHSNVHLLPSCTSRGKRRRDQIFPIARSTTSGVIGISVIGCAASGRNASLTAFMIAP